MRVSATYEHHGQLLSHWIVRLNRSGVDSVGKRRRRAVLGRAPPSPKEEDNDRSTGARSWREWRSFSAPRRLMRGHARIGSIRPISTSPSSWIPLPPEGGQRRNRPSPPCIASQLRDRSPAPNNKRAISPARRTQAITEAMDEARHADDEGDSAGCEKALNDVDRMLKR